MRKVLILRVQVRSLHTIMGIQGIKQSKNLYLRTKIFKKQSTSNQSNRKKITFIIYSVKSFTRY